MRKDWTGLIRQDLEDLTSIFSTGGVRTDTLLPGDRRSVAVLYLDLAGFTAMSENLDHEMVHEICTGVMTVLSRIVTFHGGYVDKFEGDRIMALFGAERIHENDCIRAVACSLRMLEAIRDLGGVLEGEGLGLAARAGISFGDVTVAPDPSGHLTTTGDQVNAASRMEETAEVGTVQVTGAVREECGEQFSWEDLGLEPVRDRSKPVRAWRPVGPGKGQVERWERASLLAAIPFVGRQDELALLENLLHLQEETGTKNRRGGAVHIVAGICGDAGIGKSRLLHECTSRVGKRKGDVLILRTACISYAQPPLGPVIGLLRSVVGEGVSTHEVVEERLAEIRSRKAGSQIPDIREETVQCIVELLSLEEADRTGFRHHDAESSRLRLLSAISDLIRMLADAHEQLVVVVDDFHWIDSASREVIEFVATNCDTEKPVLFLLLYRPQPSIGNEILAGLPEGYVTRHSLNLAEIGESGARKIVSRLLGLREEETVTDSLGAVDFLLKTSGGNIFFLEELVLGMTETGVLERTADGGWVLLADPEGIPMPSTISALVRSRVDHLPESPRQVLQLASVLGNEFHGDVLGSMISRAYPSIPNADDLLKELCSRGFFHGSSASGEMGFRHALIRDAVYSSILRHNRRILHSICAEVLLDAGGDDEALVDAVACHWEDAGDRKNTLFWGEKALFLASERSDWSGVLDWSRRLGNWLREPLESADDAVTLYRILMQRQKTEGILLTRRERFWTLERLDRILRDGRLEAEKPDLFLAWGEYYRSTENMVEALNTYTAALKLFETAGNSTGRACAMSGIALCYSALGNLKEAADWQKEAIDLLRMEDNAGRLAGALRIQAEIAQMQGRLDQAIPLLEEALIMARESGDRTCEADVLMETGLVHKTMGRSAEALSLTEESLGIIRETGNRKRELLSLNRMCILLRDLGRIEESREYGIQALEACREAGERRMEGNVLCSLAILERLEHRLDRALDYYHQSLERHRAVGNRTGEAIVLGNIGNALTDLYRMDEAIDYYLQSADLHRKTGRRRILAEVVGWIAVNSLDMDRPDGVEACIEEARQVGEETDNQRALMLADLASAKLMESRGELEDALKTYRKAYAAATGIGQNRESVSALTGMARIRIIQKRYGEARKHLLGALSISGQSKYGSAHLECSIHLSMAELHLVTGKRRKAQKTAEKAMEYALTTGNAYIISQAKEIGMKCSPAGDTG